MFNLKEYRYPQPNLFDRLVWAALVDKGVVLNKTGSFQKTLEIRGHDLDIAEGNIIDILCQRVNNVLRRFGSGWAFYYDVERVQTISYPTSKFPDAVSLLIDEERRYKFEQNGCFFETKVYLTLLWLPPTEMAMKSSGMFYSNDYGKNDYAESMLLEFKKLFPKFVEMLKSAFLNIRELDDSETLTYLHNTVSTKRHKVKVPDSPMFLDYLLADEPVVGGFYPKIGNHHLRILSIRFFPSTSLGELLGDLNTLDMEFRWTTRWIALDKEESLKLLKKYQGKLFSKRIDLLNMIGSIFGVQLREKTGLSSDADDKAFEMDIAKKWVEGDLVSYGYYTTTIMVTDEDEARCQAKINRLESFINNKQFTCVVENKNAIEAWLGSLPGNTYANVRKPMMHSGNLSHLITLSNAWAGQEENAHFKKTCGEGAPLMITETLGNTPWRAVYHRDDVGHTKILGPTGTGKSLKLQISSFQFLRYPGARVINFDKGYSAFVSTHAVGGKHYDLGGELTGNEHALQPLADLDTEADLRWALEWVENLVKNTGIKIRPKHTIAITKALNAMSSMEKKNRTLTTLQTTVMHDELKEALRSFMGNGAYAKILDGDCDIDINSNWICFEMSTIMSSSRAVLVPILDCLFRKIKKLFIGNPTLVVIDEFWEYIGDPHFVKMARNWLKTERKNNVSIWMATQTIGDAVNNPDNREILSSLLEDVPNGIYLPNPAVKTPKVRELYESFGFSPAKLNIIENAIPKKHYFFDSPDGSRLFDLGMGPIGLAFAGASGIETARVAQDIINKYGAENFAREWLLHLGVDWAADCLKTNFLKDSEGKLEGMLNH